MEKKTQGTYALHHLLLPGFSSEKLSLPAVFFPSLFSSCYILTESALEETNQSWMAQYL